LSNKRVNHAIAPVFALGLIGAMALGRWSRLAPHDAEPYHARVRAAIEAVPYRVGDWVGTDQPIVEAAVKLLQPNAMLNRVYRNIQTGRTATLLIVHCKDARDLAGHYPPVCYPAHGWQEDDSRERDWAAGSLPITGMEYAFSYGEAIGRQRMTVANFMVLPTGEIRRDMAAVREVAADYTRHFFGAAQFQIIMDTSIPSADRDAIVAELLGAVRPVIDAIRAGEKK
jgi:Protein of unknown function (DUF3485)